MPIVYSISKKIIQVLVQVSPDQWRTQKCSYVHDPLQEDLNIFIHCLQKSMSTLFRKVLNVNFSHYFCNGNTQFPNLELRILNFQEKISAPPPFCQICGKPFRAPTAYISAYAPALIQGKNLKLFFFCCLLVYWSIFD